VIGFALLYYVTSKEKREKIQNPKEKSHRQRPRRWAALSRAAGAGGCSKTAEESGGCSGGQLLDGDEQPLIKKEPSRCESTLNN
jgi:hypothetical protein